MQQADVTGFSSGVFCGVYEVLRIFSHGLSIDFLHTDNLSNHSGRKDWKKTYETNWCRKNTSNSVLVFQFSAAFTKYYDLFRDLLSIDFYREKLKTEYTRRLLSFDVAFCEFYHHCELSSILIFQ